MENQAPKKTLAIIGMVLGIVTFVFCWIPGVTYVAIATGIAGIILSVLGQKKFKAVGQKNAMATVGLILSIIGLVFAVVMTIIYCACTAALTSAASDGSLSSALEDAANGYVEDFANELSSALS